LRNGCSIWVGVLYKITQVLSDEGVPYELIGGLVVLIHVEEANPELTHTDTGR
jgi:hypothetical protein